MTGPAPDGGLARPPGSAPAGAHHPVMGEMGGSATYKVTQLTKGRISAPFSFLYGRAQAPASSDTTSVGALVLCSYCFTIHASEVLSAIFSAGMSK